MGWSQFMWCVAGRSSLHQNRPFFFSSSAPFSTFLLWATLMTDALEDVVNICTLTRPSLPD
jgi:hypothetical protein